MLPIIYAGDKITIEKRNCYNVGDVILFELSTKNLILHRVIRITSKELWCKGDNSFHIELISNDNVIGVVTYINGTKIAPAPEGLIEASLCIGKRLILNNGDIEKTKTQIEYKNYKEQFLDNII